MGRGRKRTKVDQGTRERWAEAARAYMERSPLEAPRGQYNAPGDSQPGVQMRTVIDLPPPIALPLSAVQREMLWAAWQGELWRDARGVAIGERRASIVTLHALRERGLVERGGGKVGITQSGEVALELLYTDPRDWSTPIEESTGSLA